MIAQSLQAAGIRRVIWIDDQFREKSVEVLRSEIIAGALALRLRGKDKLYHNSLTGGVVSLPDDEDLLRANVSAALPDDVAVLVLLQDALRRQLRSAGTQADFEFTGAEFKDVIRAMREGQLEVLHFSYVEWSIARKRIPFGEHDTLLLVDRDFRGESVEDKGEAIIESVLKDGKKAYFVLLSQDFGTAEIEQERNEILKKFAIPRHAFAMVSKKPEVGEDAVLSNRLAVFFRQSLLCHVTHLVGQRVSGCVTDAAAEVANQLATVSVYEIDKALYENSLTEGISEVEVILRLIQSRQRALVHRVMADAGVRMELARMRKVRASSPSAAPVNQKDPMPVFRGWRNEEVLLDGVVLNRSNLPLANGDVFEISAAAGGGRFMLLAQPCDLIVRKVKKLRGQRNAEEGIFVGIEAIAAQTKGKDEDTRVYHFLLDGILLNGKKWRLNYHACCAVNLNVLDLCVFNEDGQARFKIGTTLETLMHEDWNERRILLGTKYQAALADSKLLPIFGVSEIAGKVIGKIEEASVSFPVQRVGRIASETAAAALSAWASFNARAALDHDFARLT